MSEQRIRLDMTAREEIIDIADGFEPLRVRIRAAHEAGDRDELTRLQHQYWNRERLPARPAPARATSVRETDQEFEEHSREVLTYVATWGVLSASEVEEDGSPCWISFSRGAFDHDLKNLVSPDRVRLRVNHRPDLDGVARWVGFWADHVGQRGLCVVDDSPSGRLLLEGLDRGEIGGFSVHAVPRRSTEREVPGPRGWPVFDVVEAELLEAGPVDEPADEGAVVLSVGGRRPRFQLVGEAVERDQLLRQVLGQQPRRAGGGIH